MKKIFIGLLVIANFITLQYHDSIKHKRDNFALCGSSIGASYSEKTSPVESGMSWTNQIGVKKNLVKQNTANKLKEISVESPDHVNLMVSAYNHDDIILTSFSILKEINSIDSLYSRAVFKPS